MDLQHQDDTNKSMKKEINSSFFRAITTATTAGMTLFVCIGLGILTGCWSSDYIPFIGTMGVFMGGLIGAIIGFYCIIRQLA